VQVNAVHVTGVVSGVFPVWFILVLLLVLDFSNPFPIK
jgi:hypothetical protein